MAWEIPVIDRTAADVATVRTLSRKITDYGWDSLSPEEQAVWLSDMKGAYNQTDLNRVGNNMAYLADLLNSYGYAVAISPKTDWAVDDIPTQSQMAKLLTDLQALENAYYTLTSTPAAPESMASLFWYDANNMEQILADIKSLLEGMIANFRYCNDVITGEGYFSG